MEEEGEQEEVRGADDYFLYFVFCILYFVFGIWYFEMCILYNVSDILYFSKIYVGDDEGRVKF